MITGNNWYEYQINEKRKQLARHSELAEIHKGKDIEKNFRQLAYDDERYLRLLMYARENSMWYRDERGDIGWCADK